jgi:hypothetical protein
MCERKLVGIRKAELDAVGGFQLVTRDPPAIDEGTVPAASVLQDVMAILRDDAGVIARRAAVADHEVVFGVTADAKGHRFQFHAQAMSGWILDDQRRRLRRMGSGPALCHARAFELEFAVTRRATPRLRACCTSSTRSIWQCEQ